MVRHGPAIRREIVTVCRRLYERGLIAGPDGNVSVRLGPNRILVTPSGQSKVDVRSEDLVELTLDGGRVRGAQRPSSEIDMHLGIYRRRPDVSAIVHAHPPIATGFAVSGHGFEDYVLPEVIVQLGRVPLVPYATPGTRSLADAMGPYIDRHDAFLLANHGATTLGPSLVIAHQRMESLEHGARILLTARLLGNVNPLTTDQVSALVAARQSTPPGVPSTACERPGASRRQA